MNNFTKEELQEIKRCVNYMIKGGTTPHSCLTMKINKQLQSMIDSYCEHKHTSDGHLYTRLGPSPYTMSRLSHDKTHLYKNNRMKCIECGEYYL